MAAVLVIELKKGVAVNVLITPRLFVYKGRQGVTLEADGENIPAVMSLYADVLYCGALNWWELSGKDADEFEYTRMDFHVWAAEHPDEFGRIVAKAVRLLSGKSLAELTDEAKKKPDAKKKIIVWLDYADIEAFLVGRCGKSEEEAGWVSMRQYILLREAAEQDERRKWERARWQMFLALQMNPYVKQKPSTPALWVPFSWEKDAEAARAQEGDWQVSRNEQLELDRLLEDFITSKGHGKDR